MTYGNGTAASHRGSAQGAEKTAEIVSHYGDVARAAEGAEAACECCEPDPAQAGEAFSLYTEEVLAGLPKGALIASRGCGDPVAKADLQAGERVLDLGSGGGIDALIAARLVGAAGHVFGLDMTPDMISLARKNAAEAGVDNVDFIEGSIDHIPLPDQSVDVVVSNCVINLCENKAAVFAEAKRVLVPGGRLVVSDIVAFLPIPKEAEEALRAITGCRRGITAADDYRTMMSGCGFAKTSIEPKTIYTVDVLREKAERKNREKALEEAIAYDVDSVCGSAIIRAVSAR